MSLPIHTALAVSTATSSPSPNCIQWSDDGQLILATRSAVYIMTPEHGINFDLDSLVRSASSNDSDAHVGWFRTMIQLDKTTAMKWPEYSQEWGAASLGSIDTSISGISISPSSLTPDAGCVIAILTSNMDLSLWVAGKNSFKGEWLKSCDVTPFLMKALTINDSPSISEVLSFQIMCVTWTSQPQFQQSPQPRINGSLLVCGSRGGCLVFVRYNEEYHIEHVKTLPVADDWLTHVAVSPWRCTSPGICTAKVAYAVADGEIGHTEVTANLQASAASAPFNSTLTLSYEFSEKEEEVCPANEQGATALQWVELSDDTTGIIGLWTETANGLSWSGERFLRITYHRVSVGSSPCLPVAGIHYAQEYDSLTVTLFDGSVHVIYDITVSPAVRAAFVRCENQGIMDIDDNRISGAVSYDMLGNVAWIHEASRTADFSYKHDAKHQSMFVVAQVWQEDPQKVILHLDRIIKSAKAYTSPLNNLRPIFFQCRSQAKCAEMHETLIRVLSEQVGDYSTEIIITPFAGELTTDVRRAFRRSLIQHLFGWDDLLRLRMRLSFADYLWKLSDAARQDDLGFVAQGFLTTISHRVLRTIIRHLAAAMGSLTPADVPFALRMVVQSLLPGCPPDLSSEGQLISEKIRALLPDDQTTNSLVERCPACKEEIPLQNITGAVCSKGHTWSRCSITTFILSTPYVRTCVGCTRKAFLPPSSSAVPADRTWLPPAGRGWVVEELLEAVHRCLFCSNTFVSLL
ncbi:transcription factor IIIC subunit delta N-term-domain-containing protein [Mucidula mucida]|nr:transcription factor IIIC subunit delta N-term-domain-containing protein [Mucidula mucida]